MLLTLVKSKTFMAYMYKLQKQTCDEWVSSPELLKIKILLLCIAKFVDSGWLYWEFWVRSADVLSSLIWLVEACVEFEYTGEYIAVYIEFLEKDWYTCSAVTREK